jgi:HemY protein
MKGLLWVILLFALAVAVALGARYNEGYVLLVFPPYRMELSLNLFILIGLFVFALAHFGLRALSLTFSLPGRVRDYRAQRQREKAGSVFQDAVRYLFEGRFGQALKKASEANANGTAPALSALIAARAAQRLGEPARQQAWIERARQDDPRNEAATLMLEAEMMLEARRFDAALDALKKLQARQGRHIAALRLELRARQGLADWTGVLKLSRQLAKRDALPPEVIVEVRTQAHLANIKRLQDDAEALPTYLAGIPAEDCSERVQCAAARALAGLGLDGEAQDLIEAVLDGQSGTGSWQPELATIYGKLTGGDPARRIARAEQWLPQHPRNGELLLALGRMCQHQRLWGKAQSYFEASLAVAETREAHLAIAHLFDLLERPDDANRHYRASARIDAR